MAAFSGEDNESLEALRIAFDEHVIAEHTRHGFSLEVSQALSAMHKLAQETYENKPLTFGFILDPNEHPNGEEVFPATLLGAKRYKALSDGFRTAYHVSTNGVLLDFVDLERFERRPLSGHNYYPEWTANIAQASRDGRRGICLSRQGDILIFDEGTLRFTYRYGRWQYWNHAHLVNLLRQRARAQHVQPKVLGRVVGAIYRAALDISFRRTGALFVILRNRSSLRQIVRGEDQIENPKRSLTDLQFDTLLAGRAIQNLPRTVIVDIASLDGAVVLNNAGEFMAYAAVLDPVRKGRLTGTEGSRTKAAIGASNYGVAIKTSSDGDITVYHAGREFIHI